MSNERLIERLSTGNEFISIPDISTSRAGIEDIGFMHSAFRACIEMHGSKEHPFLQPIVEIDGKSVCVESLQHELISYWIPRFTAQTSEINAEYLVFAPLDRRGFICLLTLENTSDKDVKVKAGFKGCWETTYHTANLSKPMSGIKHASVSASGLPVIEYRGNIPLHAIAMASQEIIPASVSNVERSLKHTGESISAEPGMPVYYELADEYILKPSEKVNIPLYVGIGLEEVSAIAAVQELRLQGWERMLVCLTAWLDTHTIECDDEYMKKLMNVNSFYNYFFSQAIALDNEELVLTTARSSRNESCAAYWDRDAMRWSLPAVLQIDWAQGRRMLIYALTTQLRNVGVHSRFIDGIVLEPGLQLDQLCAPIRALQIYVQLTGDMSILFDRRVQAGVNTIQQILAAQRHSEAALFETLLLPSGQPSKYPYVCFANVLVWRILHDMSWLYNRIRDLDRADEAGTLASLVKQDIAKHFIVEGPMGKMFAYAVDLQGNYELCDDPAGSLQLLSYFGYCSSDDPVYRNTVIWIHSEHNPCSNRVDLTGAYSPPEQAEVSILSVINELLAGRKNEALDFLRRVQLDDGFACESVDRNTGKIIRGKAFASCAGNLAFALRLALNAKSPDTAVVQQKRRPSETLYEPPPDDSHNIKKARL